MLNITNVIGTTASIISVISFTPQAWKIIKTRDTKSISAKMYALTVAGFALWLAYGFLLQSWPLIISNGLCFLLSGFILAMKLLPQRGKDTLADHLDPPETTTR